MYGRVSLFFQQLLCAGMVGVAAGLRSAADEVMVTVESRFISHPRIQVNTGDTVVWKLPGGNSGVVNSVASFTGEWSSPFLTDDNPSFAYTFNTPGFYAYRLFRYLPPPPYEPPSVIDSVRVGTITVVRWTNGPSAVSINVPVKGSHFAWHPDFKEPVPLLATVSPAFGEIERVEFHAGTNLVGVVTSAPYAATFTNVVLGAEVIAAKAVSRSGAVAWSQTVSFSHEAIEIDRAGRSKPKFYPPRIERGKLFVVEYLPSLLVGREGIYGLPYVPFGLGRFNLLSRINASGAFVDDVSTNQMRFFVIDQAQ